MEEDFMKLINDKEKEYDRKFTDYEFNTFYDFYILGKVAGSKNILDLIK